MFSIFILIKIYVKLRMKIKLNAKKEKIERPGREIKIDNSVIGNNNVSVRIGTTDNKNCPTTVYIVVTFWVDIKNKATQGSFSNFDEYISKKYVKEIKQIKTQELKEVLSNNKYFPFYYDNIFTFDFPENINYNDKRSFTTLELTLHTLNCDRHIANNYPYPLKNKPFSEIYIELIKIAQKMCSTDLLNSKLDFKIYKTKK